MQPQFEGEKMIEVFDISNKYVKKIIKMDTPKSSYCIGIVDDEQFVGHAYYGSRVNDYHLENLFRINEMPYVPSHNGRDRAMFMDSFPFEYSTGGTGDFRENALRIETEEGYTASTLCFCDMEITEGKPSIPNLPATFDSKETVSTLILHCEDKFLKLKVDLYYSVFEDLDVITRSVRITNDSQQPIYLSSVYSACLDMDNKEFSAVTLDGSWARERHISKTKVGPQSVSVSSQRGASSHQHNPFMMLVTENTTDTTGEVYAMNLVYSGNFSASVSEDPFGQIRMLMGINPVNFKWKLESKNTFCSPEAVLVYSSEGTGKMTRTFHDLYRNHLIRSPYKDKKRPILINNWEATYFDFNTEKLIAIAKEASRLGIEMLVMDDGWFGIRNDDNTSLGDWKVNEAKINGGLKYLVDEINKLGMKFGIWFEPEMISPDSDLYRAHPDWAIAVPKRVPVRSRNQYVLDMSRKEVVDYTYESIASVLRSANIEYVKWDMNRQLTDLGSLELPADRMGELCHRFVMGTYELQERLLGEFPDLLLENCTGGGGRFDPGMLYYSPQIWCSDDTDAIERLIIQEGTAMVYPLSTMGAHVSDCPNHITGRVTPFKTRADVALAGTFGYELDVTRIPKEDVEQIPSQVANYHKYNDLVRSGDYYRIASYSQNNEFDCYGVVSKDKKEALFTFVQVKARPNAHSRIIRLKGLDTNMRYHVEGEESEYTGDLLEKAGLLIPNLPGDYQSRLIHLTATS